MGIHPFRSTSPICLRVSDFPHFNEDAIRDNACSECSQDIPKNSLRFANHDKVLAAQISIIRWTYSGAI